MPNLSMIVFLSLPMTAWALRLPGPAALRTTAAASLASAPWPALASVNHPLPEGVDPGDVVVSGSGMASAALGVAATLVIVGLGFDYMLKFGADEACIISAATGKEVCGKVIDDGEQGCVLSDREGWVCSA